MVKERWRFLLEKRNAVMKTLKFCIMGILLLALGLGVKSGSRDTTYHAKVEGFLTRLTAGDVDGAYQQLVEPPQTQEQKEIVETLKIRTSTALKMFTKPLGIEYVKEQRYGKSIVRVVYLIKYDRQPLIWEFYFYKPQAEWKLLDLRFSDKLDAAGDK
jgi:hypothetical protein